MGGFLLGKNRISKYLSPPAADKSILKAEIQNYLELTKLYFSGGGVNKRAFGSGIIRGLMIQMFWKPKYYSCTSN